MRVIPKPVIPTSYVPGSCGSDDSGWVERQDGLKHAFGLGEAQLGLTVSALLPGCAFGAFLAGRFADIWGRRKVMIVAAPFFIISALASGASPSALIRATARFFAGVAVGAASVLSPAYISEVTPAHVRGRLSSAQQVMVITGLSGAFFANYFLAEAAGSSLGHLWGGQPAWRWMFWVQALPALLFFVSLFGIPESPRFLVAKGHMDEARVVLAGLFGSASATAKLADIEASLSQRPQAQPRRNSQARRRMAADHLDRRRSRLIPAARRHQRRLLLWGGALAGGRFQ
nr:MFS transporter [Sphingobium sp. EP60837]